MVVVEWELKETAPRRKQLTAISQALRGEDLLVDLGRDRFLLLLPHTPQGGSQILISRIRERLGDIPIGGTFWETEMDDLQLRMAQHRCEIAMKESAVEVGHPFVWRFLRPEDVESTA